MASRRTLIDRIHDNIKRQGVPPMITINFLNRYYSIATVHAACYMPLLKMFLETSKPQNVCKVNTE